MPEAPLTPDKRTLAIDPADIAPPKRADFVELGLVSCFSFLRGASDAVDLMLTAHAQGYDALGIADVNSLAGVVRIHTEAKALRIRPVVGCRIETVEGLAFLAYPENRAAYGRLTRLISAGKMQTLSGDWQDKGVCEIDLLMLAEHCEGVQLILLPPGDLEAEFSIQVPSNVIPFRRNTTNQTHQGDEKNWDSLTAPFPELLQHLVRQLPTLKHLAASYLHRGDDVARIERFDSLARTNGLGLLATNDVHYHAPERRALQDVMTAIRHKTTVAKAGHLLHPNAERHLKSPQQMQRLFARWPHAIAAAREVADRCRFSLDELRYEYPEEIYPGGQTPQAYLEGEVSTGATRRYPDGLPNSVRQTLERELALIAKLDLARYFLTIKDIVDFARGCDPPILCQGRGSAANSAVCYVLGITSVDPAKHQLLFDRFIS
jgi:error-prone DNA polymerase